MEKTVEKLFYINIYTYITKVAYGNNSFPRNAVIRGTLSTFHKYV